jgi:hypothetical protein
VLNGVEAGTELGDAGDLFGRVDFIRSEEDGGPVVRIGARVDEEGGEEAREEEVDNVGARDGGEERTEKGSGDGIMGRDGCGHGTGNLLIRIGRRDIPGSIAEGGSGLSVSYPGG